MKQIKSFVFFSGERVCTKTCAERSRSIGDGFGPAPLMPLSQPLVFISGNHGDAARYLWQMVDRSILCTGYEGQWETSEQMPPAYNENDEPEHNQFFYHSVHASTGLSTGLGSASFITDATGYVDQHIQYLPFGELFISQRNSEFDSRYKFTAKELDNETNYTYFGARYYDSDISIWLSIDPLSDKYPSLSPYAYCAGNPVILVDPDGMSFDHFTIDAEGNLQLVETRPEEDFHVIFRKEDYDAGKRDYDDTGTKSGMKINKRETMFFKSKIVPIKCPWDRDITVEKTNTYEIGLNNPETAKNLFEFLTSSSKFEFSHQWFEKGDQTLNVLYTALQEGQVPGNISRARKYKAQGWIYTRSDHNHPNNNPKPSGYPGGQRGDIPNKEWVLREFPNVEFNIYTPSNRKYTPY